MRKALVLIVIPSLLTSLSIAEGSTHGKTAVSARSAFAPARAKVRVVHPASRYRLASSVALEESRPLLPIVDQPDIRPDDQLFLDRVLRIAPTLCRENIEHLVVRYPSDRGRAGDPPIERGQATASTMILRGPLATLSSKEQAEMIGVIIHECGHIVDLGALQGSPRSGESSYPDGHVPTYNDDQSRTFYEISWENVSQRREDARDEDFVSGYAKADPFEDLAESLVYFALHERAFRERAVQNPLLARKLEWLETYVFKDANSPIASESWPASRSLARPAEPFGRGEGWDGTIAWDVTKLAHALAF